MVATSVVTLIGLVAIVLTLSFAFWIFVAYGAMRFVKFGMCSVCGSVVSVWVLNLFFHFLPGWVTLLLLGQSVVGGASLFRDMILIPHAQRTNMPLARYGTIAQLLWFGLILGGTFTLGMVGLTMAVL